MVVTGVRAERDDLTISSHSLSEGIELAMLGQH